MDALAQAAVDKVQQAFAGETGPVAYDGEGSGWFYEFEGHGIENALLSLDPVDVRLEDLELDNSAILAHATEAGYRWIIPGIVRAIFELGEKGDYLNDYLFDMLEFRARHDRIALSRAQKLSLLDAHQAYYGTDQYDWDAEAHESEFVKRLRMELESSESSGDPTVNQ